MGYFIGAAAVSYNFQFALGLMLILILLAMPWAIISESSKGPFLYDLIELNPHISRYCFGMPLEYPPDPPEGPPSTAACVPSGLSNKLGRARSKNLSLFQIFQQKYNVNVLSVSR